MSLGSDLWVRLSFTDSLSEEPCCRLNLSDEDTNSILTDNANRAIQGYLAMQVTQPGGQLWNQAMQVTSPDDQILNQFATNEKIHTQKKYKSDCKKYRKSEVEKYESISVKI